MMSRSVLGLLIVATLTLTGGSAKGSLEEYVKKADPAFTWKLEEQREVLGSKIYRLSVTSQVWQSIPWKHDVVVVLPGNVEPTATMFLWNQGGKASTTSQMMAMHFAQQMRAPVAFLFGIPNQPLFMGLKEDALIAETFVRYLETKDGSWPLLFPMVKSVVKTMDALQTFARQEWKKDVKQFVLSGASKRGWTTWLSAASDPRIKAIVPMVIDTLNMQKQMPHQLEAFGAYSAMIADYTHRKLVPMPNTPEAKKLWSMVDPWLYRKKITMPKLIMNGTNDPYWTQDALNLYWDDLSGDKWICYVPNAGHNLEEKTAEGKANRTRALSTLSAFTRAHVYEKPLPRLSWKHTDAEGKHCLKVSSDLAPKAARLWMANASTLDFRKSRWSEKKVSVDGKDSFVEVETPTSGCRVYYVEYEYDLEGLPYWFSTQLRIVGAPAKK